MQIFFGILAIVLAIFYIKYNYQITNMVGKFPWAENYIGLGGTYLVHKLFAIVIIILSIMWMTGTFQTFLSDNVGPYFGGRI
ncbi:hypothetical protein KA517_02170 [Candidatus Gracilibacteria bacterium]|nr:hypothetical protein [Candidatus Gracilibacteria bacterium]